MRFDLTQLYHGCPKELEKDLCDLYYSCSTLAMKSQIFPSLSEDELFMRISIVKENLLIILARFSTLLNQNNTPKSKYELSVKLKFIEDLGEVYKSIDKESALKNLNIRNNNFPVYYNMINEFVSIFDFVVYQPIVAANKKEIPVLNDYILEIFKIASANCAIIGHSIRSDNKVTQTSRGILSKSSASILNEFDAFPEDSEGGDSEGEEETEDSEEEEPKEIVEEIPTINVKPTPKKRGRPKKKC